MRVLGIDYGSKYIGLAVGDLDLRVATPLREISSFKALVEVGRLVKEESIEKIIVGLPLSFKMEETAESKKVRVFGEQLEADFEVPVMYQNEILTTTQVERETGSKSHSGSATLMLQSWLDRQG